MKLENLRICITGASSGIGRLLTEQLALGEGNRILAVARHTENIPAVSGRIFPFSADCTRAEEIDKIFDYMEAQWGGIDLYIANAGFAYREKSDQADWKHIQNIFDLNTIGQIYALQRFMQKPDTDANGKVRQKYFVSTISAVAMIPLPYYALYCATKSALDGYLKTFRFEKPEWLNLLRVYPIATRTAFFTRASGEDRPPLPFLSQKPEQVTSAILRALKKNRKKVYPSLLFACFYPLIRAFPCLSYLYSWNEKKKMEKHFLVGSRQKHF